MKDTEWLKLINESPQKARSLIADEYKNLVYAVVLSKLKGNAGIEEIEDCVNDAFAEIFDSLADFSESKGTLKTFISTIAARVAINNFKRSIYRKKSTSSIDDDDTVLPPSDSDTEADVQNAAFRRRLWEIVDTLGEPDSKIIVYQYCYELKVREIAAMLSMTPYAVQKRSIRARKRIKKILEKENLI